jgi:hypothetical protein
MHDDVKERPGVNIQSHLLLLKLIGEQLGKGSGLSLSGACTDASQRSLRCLQGAFCDRAISKAEDTWLGKNWPPD